MTPKNWNSKIRAAVQRMHKAYRKCPWMFMNETDVHCRLYAELLKDFSVARTAKRALRWKFVDGEEVPASTTRDRELKTIAVHANLATRRGKHGHQFPDLCLVDPSSLVFEASDDGSWPRYFKNYEYLKPEHSVGIEIKFRMYSGRTNPRKVLVNGVKQDIKKLVAYRRGWFVLVDQMGVFQSREAWKSFFATCARAVNGRVPNEINAYYISPKFGSAICYRHRKLSR